LSFRWVASCGTSHGSCAGRRPPPSPNRRTHPWCSAARPSHSGSASPRPTNAPPGRGPETAPGSPPSPRPSAPCRAAFFGLARLPHRRLVPLEPRVLQQGGPARVADRLPLGHLLVVRLARVRAAQVADPLAVRVDDDHVLVAVRLLLAAVVQPLFFRVLRALAAPL